ncbi:hypothetical protein A2U01_0054486, partial [Trifolium medium]|nr:hypothetical protein [Trifolium medium]
KVFFVEHEYRYLQAQVRSRTEENVKEEVKGEDVSPISSQYSQTEGRSQQQWETSHQRVTMRGYCKRTDNNQISSRWWEDESDEHYDKPVPEKVQETFEESRKRLLGSKK